MSITFRRDPDTVSICDFAAGFQSPDVVKHRPEDFEISRPEYNEVVPALPPGIGLEELTPRSVSADGGGCFSLRPLRIPSHVRLLAEPDGLRRAVKSQEPIGATLAGYWR